MVNFKIFILKRHILKHLYMKFCDDWDSIQYNLCGEKRVGVKINRIGHRLLDPLIILSGFVYI